MWVGYNVNMLCLCICYRTELEFKGRELSLKSQRETDKLTRQAERAESQAKTAQENLKETKAAQGESLVLLLYCIIVLCVTSCVNTEI